MKDQWLTSVGIDVGTSTTKMIISRLRIARMSSPFALPRYDIVERKVMYESPMLTTPLLSETLIDAERIAAWLLAQYELAGVRPPEVSTGAVIFTGESAGKQNAEPILHMLAQDSGAFVVAAAGNDLEAVLAAKGSGALHHSREQKEVIANIDIGGGTANIACCYRGKVIHTETYHVGGRLIRLEPDGTITYVSSALSMWLKACGIHIRTGDQVEYADLAVLAESLSRSLLSAFAGEADEHARLLLAEGSAARQPNTGLPACRKLIISGGIGQWYYYAASTPRTLADVAVYGDIGPLLAYALRRECQRLDLELLKPLQTSRATVLGAGMQSTEISGSTVYIDGGILPLRNVPIVELELSDLKQADDWRRLAERVKRLFQEGATLYGETIALAARETKGSAFGCAIVGLRACTYAELQHLSECLLQAFRSSLPHTKTMVVVCERDMAKALGQLLVLACQGNPSVICIDQIRVEHGDYMDLGLPVNGTTIPVIVKTLAM